MKIKYSDNWESEVKVDVSVNSPDRWRKAGKTVVYVWGTPNPEDIYPDEWTKEKMKLRDDEVQVKGSKVWKQYNKQEKEFATRVIKLALPEIKRQMVEYNKTTNYRKIDEDAIKDLSEHKIVFDRKAGCSCGCSPGYRFKTDKYKNIVFVDWKDIGINISLQTEEEKAKAEHTKKVRRVEDTKNEIEGFKRKLEEIENTKQTYLNKITTLSQELVEYEKALGE